MTPKPIPPHDGDGLVEALRAALAARPDLPEGLTTDELADALSMSKVRVNKLLRDMAKKGVLMCHHVGRMAVDQRLRPVPVYSLKK